MAATTNRRVIVEIEPGADPIRGSIAWPAGRGRPFWGWLELIEELQRVAGGESGVPHGRPLESARGMAAAPVPGRGAGGSRRRRR